MKPYAMALISLTTDNYREYIQLKGVNSKIIEIFIYSSSCEIDGLFEVSSDFDLGKYKTFFKTENEEEILDLTAIQHIQNFKISNAYYI